MKSYIATGAIFDDLELPLIQVSRHAVTRRWIFYETIHHYNRPL